MKTVDLLSLFFSYLEAVKTLKMLPIFVIRQEQYWRSVLFHNHYSFLSSSGYEIDEEAETRSQKEQQELLMKMFAVSVEPSVAPLLSP